MQTKANLELDAGAKTFTSGLLPEIIRVIRNSRPGDLIAITSGERSVGADLAVWCRFTGNSLIETTVDGDRTRWLVRCGVAPANADAERPVGSRLWLYTNFD